MNILCLDLGTKTGYATLCNGQIESGVQSFQPTRFEGAGMRYLKFNRWLRELHDLTQFEAVWYEEVRRHIGTDAAHAYGGFLSHLQSWCEVAKVPYDGIPVGTIKKHFTGHGGANKQKMLDEAARRGWSVSGDDEADARALLDYVQKVIL